MPLLSTVRKNRLLTRIALEFKPGDRLADRILAPVPVANEVDEYPVFDYGNFNVPFALRAPGGFYKEIDYSLTYDTYRAHEYGLEFPLDDRIRRNAVGIFDAESKGTQRLTNNILNGREKRVASLVLSTAAVTQNTTLSGTSQWSHASSDPVATVTAGRKIIQNATGQSPNKLAFGKDVLEALYINPAIKAFLGTDRGSIVTLELLAELFRVDEVMVGSQLANTAKEGQTIALGDLWSDNALLFHQAPYSGTADQYEPSFGYQFRVQDLQTERYRSNRRKSDVVRVTEIGAEKIVAPALGYLIKDVLA